MRISFSSKKLSDGDIIRRGPPRRSTLLNIVALLGVVAFPFIIGGGFVAGALIGGGLGVTGGVGAAGFVSGLATGALWGGILSSIGMLGAAIGHRALDERDEKRVDRLQAEYEAAFARKRAAQKAAVPEIVKPLPDKGAAVKAFAKEPEVVVTPARPAPQPASQPVAP